VTKEETGANTETDKQFIYNTYTELLKDVDAKARQDQDRDLRGAQAKELFVKEPANMKLLVVVDKLLTGFDAPPCTYLYIDKSMQDHGLFQAICRTNRLDGEDKDFGYIVDYKDLFKKVEKRHRGLHLGAGSQRRRRRPRGAAAGPAEEGRKRLDDALEALALLCEPVEPPKGELEHIHYFCGNTEIPEDLKEREPQRWRSTRQPWPWCAPMPTSPMSWKPPATPPRHPRIKAQVQHYLDLREIIRKASGETLDLKPYEADMRHLIDTYIEADEPRKISPFDGMGLLDLIVKTGIADAIARAAGRDQGQQGRDRRDHREQRPQQDHQGAPERPGLLREDVGPAGRDHRRRERPRPSSTRSTLNSRSASKRVRPTSPWTSFSKTSRTSTSASTRPPAGYASPHRCG
jgi:type I restriction enzyme R subunit